MVSSVEDKGLGVVFEWLHDRQVLVVRSHLTKDTTSRQKVDVWAKSCIEAIHQWPTDRLFLTINDTTHSGYSPYAAKRAEDIVKAYPKNAQGRIAMVIPGGPLHFVMRFAAEKMVKHHLKNIELGIFKEYDPALQWISEKVTP